MSSSNIRLSDAERSRALDALGTHFAEGRLNVAEFEERSGKAAAATTRGELTPLFRDLPDTPNKSGSTEPSAELAALKRKRDVIRFVDSAAGMIAFVVFLVLHFAFHLPYAWLVFLLIPVATGGVRKIAGLTTEEEQTLKVLERKQVQEQAKRLQS
ncbi:DUF1707 domain-containing protein [Staphylococcus chromogenes]|nr:DUF1707 domain-containing protein [Staphylococcus chromogenes]